MAQEPSITVHLKLSKPLADTLRVLAKSDGRTVTNLIRLYCTQGVARDGVVVSSQVRRVKS